MPNSRIHLVVLFGGQSAEHEVSCVTAAHVLAAAAGNPDYRITPIGIATTGQWMLSRQAAEALAAGPAALPARLDPDGDELFHSQMLAGIADSPEQTVVLPLLHGPMGEDGTVQGLLELGNVAYAGAGVLGSAVAMDKALAKQLTGAAGLPQARYVAVRERDITPSTADALAAELGLPCFVKPANMGSSVGVSKAHDVDELRRAIDHALTYDEWIVVEEAIVGRELELAVIGNPGSKNDRPFVSVPGEIIPGDEFYSYDDKYVNDTSSGVIPADLTPEQTAEVQALALRYFETLRGDGLARCDFFLEERRTDGSPGRGFLCNEVNTMPGFTPISMFPKLLMASGWTYPEIVDQLVELALERHARRRRNTKH